VGVTSKYHVLYQATLTCLLSFTKILLYHDAAVFENPGVFLLLLNTFQQLETWLYPSDEQMENDWKVSDYIYIYEIILQMSFINALSCSLGNAVLSCLNMLKNSLTHNMPFLCLKRSIHCSCSQLFCPWTIFSKIMFNGRLCYAITSWTISRNCIADRSVNFLSMIHGCLCIRLEIPGGPPW